YLGWKIFEEEIVPRPICIVNPTQTLNDLQKLLGTINWLHPLLRITTHSLSPFL
ncbi:POK8 protein, partial [Pedionomus torquatus]|nr:POK8 protein [Pedionomus torquatus]